MAFTDKLNKMDVMKLKAPTGKTYAEELYKASLYLADCIQWELDNFYNSYDPVMYERSYNLYNSLSVSDFADIKIVGNTLSLELKFDSGIYHSSLYGNHNVNTLWLMNYGYEVEKDVWFKDIPMFGFREGGHFIEKGIATFNATNALGFKIKPTYQGQEINEDNYDSFRMY